MDTETQRYVDKSMESVKAQNDARFSEVLSRLDSVGSQLKTQGDLIAGRLNVIDGDLRSTKDAAERAESASRSLKWNILASLIGVAGVLLALAALWAQGVELVNGTVEMLRGASQ